MANLNVHILTGLYYNISEIIFYLAPILGLFFICGKQLNLVVSERYRKGIQNNLKGNLIVGLILFPILALIIYIRDHWDKILEFLK